MVRLLLFLVFVFLFIEMINVFVYNIKKKNNDTVIQKTSNNKNSTVNQSNKEIKDERYWWYNAPHYWISPSGRQINMPDYFTYEEYKNAKQDTINHKLLCIENILEKAEQEKSDQENIRIENNEM